MLELKKDRDITFSFVVHVRDAAGDVAAFWSNLKGVADQFEATYEVLFVDDGSVDETPGILQELVEGSDCVRAITLSRCFGYEAAVTAGADLATGSAILCMPCADRGAVDVITEMVSLWRRGASVVAAASVVAGAGVVVASSSPHPARNTTSISTAAGIRSPLITGSFPVLRLRGVARPGAGG